MIQLTVAVRNFLHRVLESFEIRSDLSHIFARRRAAGSSVVGGVASRLHMVVASRCAVFVVGGARLHQRWRSCSKANDMRCSLDKLAYFWLHFEAGLE